MTAGSAWGAVFASASASATDVYEQTMVPRLFDPWAALLLAELSLQPAQTVVDVATGPGTVARLAATRVGSAGDVIGCDFSRAMLTAARTHPAAEDAAPIRYVECPADALAVDDHVADVVICQQGLQFFPDRSAAAGEMHRIVRPSGRLGVAVWRSIDECGPFAALAAGLAEILGEPTADTYRGGPWGFTDVGALSGLADAAGFRDVTITRHELPLTFDDAAQLTRTVLAAGVAPQVADLGDAGWAALVQAVSRAAASMTRDGAIRGSAAANLLLATA